MRLGWFFFLTSGYTDGIFVLQIEFSQFSAVGGVDAAAGAARPRAAPAAARLEERAAQRHRASRTGTYLIYLFLFSTGLFGAVSGWSERAQPAEARLQNRAAILEADLRLD